MTTSTRCPGQNTLEDLLANRLSAAAADRLRAHVATCDSCQRKLACEARFPFLEPSADGGPALVGGYRVKGVLGEGGMGIVFDAEDEGLHREVALKILRPDKARPGMRERFLHEARILASVENDHVVHIYAVGEAPVPFMAMERLRGETLEQRLSRDGPIPLEEALTIARQIAEGLAAIQVKHLVHRDLKPANIWVAPGRAVLLDFGIARRTTDAVTLSTAGQIVGTPSYMAPEQALGLPVDGRADLYALGCVLYHMVTGHSPFPGKEGETAAVLEAVIKGEAPPVSWRVPTLPVEVATLIQDLMSREPQRRPATAKDLIARLRLLSGEPVGPPSPPPRTPSRRSLVLGAAALAALVALRCGGPGPARVTGGPSGDPIKVGILHSMTGPLSLHERPIVHATQLAIDEINEAGGVLGGPIVAVARHGASDEDIFAMKARRLIGEDGVEVIFGCWASAARKSVGTVCDKEGRLLFYPTSYEGLGDKPSVVYLGGSPNQTLIPLIRWAHSSLKRRSFFLLGSENVDSHAANVTMRHEIEALRAKVVGERYVLVGETALEDVADQIGKSKADFIVNTLDGQSNIALVNALRARGIRPPAVPTAWYSISESELALFRIDEVVGDYTVANYFESLDIPINRAFVARFNARFLGERVSDSMETAYAGVYLWKQAVEKAGTTETSAVRAALKGLTVEAPGGTIRLSDDQHAWRTARVGRIVSRAGQPEFEVVFSTPGPIPPEPFPAWRTREEWLSFLDGLYTKWGNRWEKRK